MVKERWCAKCGKEFEEKEVIKHHDYDEIVLACGHTSKDVRRSLMEHVSVSDSVAARVIRFESDEEMDRAFYELIHNSNSGFSGIGEREISITKEQEELLKRKNILYKPVS
jgi:hypothetical protein